ncbi:hypothetical protein ACTFIW_013031 [Dictyostelium discoideum]
MEDLKKELDKLSGLGNQVENDEIFVDNVSNSIILTYRWEEFYSKCKQFENGEELLLLLKWVEIIIKFQSIISKDNNNNNNNQLKLHNSWFEKKRFILNKLSILSTSGNTLIQFCKILNITSNDLNNNNNNENENGDEDEDEDENEISILHLIIELSKMNNEIKIDQIKQLFKFGLNINQIYKFKTPLDCAAEQKNIELFKELIELGCGEFSSHYIINKLFYKQLSYEQKVELKPYMMKLFNRNPKLSFRICFDQLFPSEKNVNGISYKFETSTMGQRYISDEIFQKIFQFGIDFKNQPSNYSRRPVAPVEDEILGLKLYVEFEPVAPSMTKASTRFSQHLLQIDSLPDTEFSIITLNNGTTYPLLIMQNVYNAESLLKLLQSKTQNDLQKIENIDPLSISKLITSTILINPSGGSLSDYLISPILKNDQQLQQQQQQKYNIIPINTDQPFVESSNVSIGLFFLNQMNDQVHPDLIKLIKLIDIHQFLTEWRLTLKQLHEFSVDLIYNKNIEKLNNGIDGGSGGGGGGGGGDNGDLTKLRYAGIIPGTILTMYSKLITLKNELLKERKTPITHWKLLSILEPKVAARYSQFIIEQQIPTNSSIIQSYQNFNQKSIFSIITETFKFNNNSNNQQQQQQPLEIDVNREIENEELIFLKFINTNHIINEEDILKISKLTPAIIQKIIKSLDFSNYDNKIINYLFKNILQQNGSIKELIIKNCKWLTFETLKSFSIFQELNIGSIRKLSIIGCSKIYEISEKGVFNSLFGTTKQLAMNSLVKLEVDRCSSLTTLKLNAPNLLTLSAIDCSQLRVFDVFAPKLKKLRIQANKVGLETFNVISTFSNLEYLDISRIVSPSTNDSIISLDLDLWKNIEILISKDVLSIDKVIISKLENLKTLDFTGCSSLREFEIKNETIIINNCPNLQTLSLKGTLINNDQKYHLLQTIS